MSKQNYKAEKNKPLKESDDQHIKAGDLDALKDFCSSIDLEEIAFDQWLNCSQTLDLVVPLFLTQDELTNGGTKTVTYTRTVSSSAPGEKKKSKPGKQFPGPQIQSMKLSCALNLRATSVTRSSALSRFNY